MKDMKFYEQICPSFKTKCINHDCAAFTQDFIPDKSSGGQYHGAPVGFRYECILFKRHNSIWFGEDIRQDIHDNHQWEATRQKYLI